MPLLARDHTCLSAHGMSAARCVQAAWTRTRHSDTGLACAYTEREGMVGPQSPETGGIISSIAVFQCAADRTPLCMQRTQSINEHSALNSKGSLSLSTSLSLFPNTHTHSRAVNGCLKWSFFRV